MDSYPPDFVSGIKSLAREVGLWIGHQIEGNARAADARMAEIMRCKDVLTGQGMLPAQICHQIRDIAVAGAALTIARSLEWKDVLEFKKDFDVACKPKPDEVDAELWRRTQDVFLALARMRCAACKVLMCACGNAFADDSVFCRKCGKKRPDTDVSAERQERRVYDRHLRHLAGLRKVSMCELPDKSESFSEEAARVIPANVIMLSSCIEGATGSSPRTPYSRAAEGRCTEIMCCALDEFSGRTWVELLWAMRRLGGTGSRKERQVPVLSSSRCMDMNTSFSVRHSNPSGRFRALLIGIDYTGQEGLEMSSGNSDVKKMRRYLLKEGYQHEHMRILTDSDEHEAPTRDAIEEGIRWLVKGSGPGDSLFLHYSGHGSTFIDEPAPDDRFAGAVSGSDEALCPVDFRTAGMIFDDEVFRHLIGPLKEGVLLTCVIDCCQSGTILHLPYAFKAQCERLDGTEGPIDTPTEQSAAMTPNADYDPGKMLQVIQSHPAMCAAAVFWAQELAALDPERHEQHLGAVLSQVSNSARAWASR